MIENSLLCFNCLNIKKSDIKDNIDKSNKKAISYVFIDLRVNNNNSNQKQSFKKMNKNTFFNENKHEHEYHDDFEDHDDIFHKQGLIPKTIILDQSELNSENVLYEIINL